MPDRPQPQAGKPYAIPEGTPVHSMGTGRWHESARVQIVRPFHVSDFDGWTIVTWPGQGGYWRRVVLRDGEFVGHWPDERAPTWRKFEAHEVRGG